jgi:hypothetical protein
MPIVLPNQHRHVLKEIIVVLVISVVAVAGVLEQRLSLPTLQDQNVMFTM